MTPRTRVAHGLGPNLHMGRNKRRFVKYSPVRSFSEEPLPVNYDEGKQTAQEVDTLTNASP